VTRDMRLGPLLPGKVADPSADFRWDIPADFNLAEVCCHAWARAEPDRRALIDLSQGQKDWSYGEVSDAAYRLAHFLRGHGVGGGDRVAILLPQCAEVILTHVAAHTLGAISLPLFTLFGPDALAYRLRDSGARVVVTDAEGAMRMRDLDLPALNLVLDIAELTGVLSAAQNDPIPPAAGAEDPAMMIYTSGTTGDPKGVLHAHRFLLGHMPSIELTHAGFGQPGDVGWTPADWAWIGGLMDLAMPCLARGVPLVARRMAKFDAEEAYDLIRTQAVTRAFLPPTAMRMMSAVDPDGAQLASISSGGEALTPDIRNWAAQALGSEVNELYGQTECNLTVSSSENRGLFREGAMGRAVPGVQIALRDASGAEVPVGEVGEITVHRDTPAMFLGYWQKPDLTAARFHGDWLRTGDLATRDADGYLTYVARDDDLISSAGYRIGPTEIETCLTGDPRVAMAAVVGVPDELRGQAVVAHVTLAPHATVEGLEDGLIARVKSRISPHVAPRRIVVRDTMPLTATGKIRRRDLRDDG